MLDILSIIPGKKRQSATGWHSFNGICCVHRGHKPDRRGRAGIIMPEPPSFNYHCFNCHFKAGWRLGMGFTSNTRALLAWAGLDRAVIDRLSLESLAHSHLLKSQPQRTLELPEFTTRELPPGSRPLDPHRDHTHRDYLLGRGIRPDQYPFYVVDGEARERIIIPYYYEGRCVGYTSRFYDDRRPKYISEQQPGYVFNIDGQQGDWQVCILCEGQFDAISIGGCAYMGSNISDRQALLIRRLARTVIVVPDQDESGLMICDRALDLGYLVSIPQWSSGIKDVNDAVQRYGVFQTVLSIIQSATGSKIRVQMARKQLL